MRLRLMNDVMKLNDHNIEESEAETGKHWGVLFGIPKVV
jgi:hypothetical protein